MLGESLRQMFENDDRPPTIEERVDFFRAVTVALGAVILTAVQMSKSSETYPEDKAIDVARRLADKLFK